MFMITDLFERDENGDLLVRLAAGNMATVPVAAVDSIICDTGVKMVELRLRTPTVVDGVSTDFVPLNHDWYWAQAAKALGVR